MYVCIKHSAIVSCLLLQEDGVCVRSELDSTVHDWVSHLNVELKKVDSYTPQVRKQPHLSFSHTHADMHRHAHTHRGWSFVG